ncbi:hypothetical protein [Lentzea sp. NBRC 105346]|uniref:hypothetical protein n=1 Tax=Lentzea sp. NBRC 105346 TaxID=3032205 RepID=UPI002554F8DE|nr:hypothetical protein [Lentzea sp. NBRC 105346]
MAFEAAVDSIDITPEFPPYPSLWMGGYGWDRRGNHGVVARRLRAHCLVIWDNDVPKVLLRADLVSVPRDVHQTIRGTLVDEGLIAENDLIILASHTHSGALYGDTRPSPFIIMGLNDQDIDAVNGTAFLITDALIQLVRDTLDQERKEVTLSYAEGEANIGFNRVGLDTVLNTVPVLRVDTVDDELFAVVFGAACHPVSRGKDDVFDGEFPAVAAELIEDELGVPALFVQGACGDQEAHDPHIPATTDLIGGILGREVVHLVDEADFTPLTGPIGTALVEIDLPFNVDTSKPSVRAMLREKYQARHDSLNPLDVDWRHADVMLKLIDDGDLPTSIPMPIQRWNLGGLSILALAHEPLSAYHVRLRKMFPGNLWVMGYANECEAYVADNDTLRSGGNLHGGYEAGWNDGDDTIAGSGCWTMSYAWPSPLKFSSGFEGGPGTAERLVIDTCKGLLGL